MNPRVLGGGVQVAHAPLQRRVRVQRGPAAQRKTGIGDTAAGLHDPNPGLDALGEQTFAPERSGLCVPPMARGLNSEEASRRL
jgi:hypothetical protein